MALLGKGARDGRKKGGLPADAGVRGLASAAFALKKPDVNFTLVEAVFRESWISIKANKLRSFLTTLGIIIGVCAVVIMVAAGQTVQNMIGEQLSGIGSNLLIIRPEMTVTAGVRGAGRVIIKTDDADVVRRLAHIRAVSPIVQSQSQVVYGNENYVASITASNTDYMMTGNWEVEKGAMFTERDNKAAATFALVGKTIADELFRGEDPIGQTIRIGNVPFIIRGQLKAKGSAMGQDQDAVAIMPLTTYRRRIRGSWVPNAVNYIMAQVDSEENIDKAKSLIEAALRESRRIKPNADNDFRIDDMTEMLDTIRSVGTYLSILLASIASISLVVGSIGIMNMMLVSVTERTREIGIRKAIGAKSSAIMGQFLLEAILISFIGSMIGMFVGIGLSQLAGALLETEVPVSVATVVLSFSVAIVVGVASGLFPAIKATRLDPIEALRYQ
ncbi:MAG: ABC transporter permease [Rickettsiales bacterium]|jgi:putative ABC transport system permease protein|nr:ABC transporter permease [Rickettsiales bacterium]